MTPPGGGNVALFSAGNHTATGNGAVGQIFNFGTTTLTGNIAAQGIGDISAVVDNGGALTLTGGALLSAQQQAIVGRTGQGFSSWRAVRWRCVAAQPRKLSSSASRPAAPARC